MKKEILHKAIDLLSRREHSAKELQQKMQNKKFIAEDISPVIQYLIEKDYLSDIRFAESVFRVRVDKGYGWLYIKNELNQKGVSSNIINELDKNEEIDWYLVAELAYNKRFSTSLDDYFVYDQFNDHLTKDEVYKKANKEKAKRIRFLQARGFSLDQIFSLINE